MVLSEEVKRLKALFGVCKLLITEQSQGSVSVVNELGEVTHIRVCLLNIKLMAQETNSAVSWRLWSVGFVDLPVTPPPRERGVSVGGAGTESGLP